MSEPDPASIGRRTAIGAGWMVAWRLATRVLGLVSTLVLARILVPADFGLVAMATTFSAAIEALSMLGLDDALIRRHDAERDLYDTAFSLQAIRGLANGLVVIAGAHAAAAWFEEPRLAPILLIIGGLTALSGLENIGIVEFRRELRFAQEFLLFFVPRIAGVAGTIIAAVLLHSYWALIVGIATQRVVRFVATYTIHPYRPRFAIRRWRDLAGFSFWTWAAGLASLLWDRSDAFILGRALPPADLGLYLLSIEIAVLPISELVSPAARALYAGITAAQRRGTDVATVTLPICCALLLLVAPLAIAVSAASGPVTTVLLGAKWTAAQPLIAIFAWLCLFSVFSQVCTAVLIARGRVRENFATVLVAAIIKIAALAIAARTGSLHVVAITAVAIVAIESVLFLVQIQLTGGAGGAADAVQGLLRAAAGVAASVLVLWLTGLGWQPPGGTVLGAFLRGAAAGLVAIAVFLAADLLLWTFGGRAAGPESRIADLAGQFGGPLLARLRRPPLAEPKPP
jgi:O-antigen/teichoic acid export membrane protein